MNISKIAHILYDAYENKYNYNKNGTWYKYENHRWIMENMAIFEIKNNIIPILTEFCSGDNNNSFMLNELLDTINTDEIKNKILDELMKLYIDCEEQLLDKLDKNSKLIGFNNGVYDLELNEFRSGKPSDYISKTVGYDYMTCENNNRYIDDINSYLNQFSEDERHYLLCCGSPIH